MLDALQLMPAGLLVTWPLPFPVSEIVSGKVFSVKVAVTLAAAFSVVTQVPVPLHPPPDQPAKVELASGFAVRVTCVPC